MDLEFDPHQSVAELAGHACDRCPQRAELRPGKTFQAQSRSLSNANTTERVRGSEVGDGSQRPRRHDDTESVAGRDERAGLQFRSLDEATADRIRAHLQQGGKIVSSAWSGLDPAREAFVLPEWGARYDGDSPHDPAYFQAAPGLLPGIPDMPNNFYGKGVNLVTQDNAESLAEIVAPYFNQHWDGEHGHVYTPPDKPTGRPAATLSDQVAHISHNVFTAYYDTAPVPLRQLVAALLDRLLPDPMVRCSGLPSYGRVMVTRQASRRMAHLLCYVPERRGRAMQMIEEPSTVLNVELALREDGSPPDRVYLAPTRESLPFDVRNGYIHVRLPVIQGHAMVVFEESKS